MTRCQASCGLSGLPPVSFSDPGPTELSRLFSPLWSVLARLSLVFPDLDLGKD